MPTPMLDASPRTSRWQTRTRKYATAHDTMVPFYGKRLRETAKALLIAPLGDETAAIWLPRSQIEEHLEFLLVPNWLLRIRGARP